MQVCHAQVCNQQSQQCRHWMPWPLLWNTNNVMLESWCRFRVATRELLTRRQKACHQTQRQMKYIYVQARSATLRVRFSDWEGASFICKVWSCTLSAWNQFSTMWDQQERKLKPCWSFLKSSGTPEVILSVTMIGLLCTIYWGAGFGGPLHYRNYTAGWWSMCWIPFFCCTINHGDKTWA